MSVYNSFFVLLGKWNPIIFKTQLTKGSARSALKYVLKTQSFFLFPEKGTSNRVEIDGFYYYLMINKQTPSSARKYCGSKLPKGDLAQIKTAKQLLEIKKLMAKNAKGINIKIGKIFALLTLSAFFYHMW